MSSKILSKYYKGKKQNHFKEINVVNLMQKDVFQLFSKRTKQKIFTCPKKKIIEIGCHYLTTKYKNQFKKAQ